MSKPTRNWYWPWTEAEDQWILFMVPEGRPLSVIAEEIGRTEDGVRRRYYQMTGGTRPEPLPEEEIRARYQTGLRWRTIYERGTYRALAREYDTSLPTVRKIVEGGTTYLGAEVEADIRARHQASVEAEPLWKKDSISAIRTEYGISGDTFARIVGEGPDVLDITRRFLTGRY